MPQLNFLTEEEIEAIHQASLRILAETGVVLTQTEGRMILESEGAHLERDRVRFPPDLVDRMVKRCPRQVTMRGRNGKVKTLGDGSLSWHNLGGAPVIFDHRSGSRRSATVQDVRDSTRLLDSLDSVTTITPFFTPQDVPGEVMSLAMYRHAMPHTVKPLQGPGVQNAVEVRCLIRMAEVLGPASEHLTIGLSPVSPLTFPDDLAAAVIETARSNVALGPLPCPTAGTTAPLSLAGALAQQNAEVLATIVLAEAVQPGLPIFYCGRLAMMEPRTGLSVWGGVELGLVSAGAVAIAHHYNLPVNVYGFSTNSHILDIQNGSERSLNAVIPALAGADELSGIGELEAGVMGSHAQIVCDSEIAAGVRRLRNGFAVNEASLAVDVIRSAMDGNRNFLAQAHTRASLRSGELLITHLAERGAWESWDRSGRESMADRAQNEAEKRIREHEVEPLSPAQEAELDVLINNALIELKVRK